MADLSDLINAGEAKQKQSEAQPERMSIFDAFESPEALSEYTQQRSQDPDISLSRDLLELSLLGGDAALFGFPARVAGVTDLREQMRKRQGLLGTGAELAGGLAGALTAAGPFLSAARLIPKIGAMTIPSAMVAGGAEGILGGYGSASPGSEGTGALIGGGLGTALPIVGYPLARFGQAILKSPEQSALSQISDVIERKGTNIADIPVETTAPTTIAEDIGAETLVREATGTMGQARDTAVKQLAERATPSARMQRISSYMEDMPKGDVFLTGQSLSEARKKAAKEAYGQSNAFNIPKGDARKEFLKSADPDTGVTLSELMRRPSIIRALPGASRRAREAGAPLKGSKLINVEEVMPFFDSVKRDLDSQIKNLWKTDPDEALKVTETRDSMLRILDEENPAFKAARNQYAGDIAVETALSIGKDFRKMNPNQIKQFLKNATESEKEHFRMGVSESLVEAMENTGSFINKMEVKGDDLEKLLNGVGEPGTNLLRQIKSAWPSDNSFNKFIKGINEEIRMIRGEKAMIGTERLAKVEGIFEGVTKGLTPAVVGRVAGGRPGQAAAVAAGNLARMLGQSTKISEDEAKVIVDAMMASTPEKRRQAIKMLEDAEVLNAEQVAKAQRLAVQMSAGVTSAERAILQ